MQMNNLQISDNSKRTLFDIGGNYSDLKNLSVIGNKSIEDLVADNTNLLIFPHSLNICPDKSYDQFIFGLTGRTESPEDQRISTGNIVGFVGYGGTQLDIHSRFQKEKGNDYFLHYMIQRVFLPNIFDFPHSIEFNGTLDFLIYLFPIFLKKALSQGIFKTYRKYEHNDAKINGSVIVNRHIKENIPFVGNVSYNNRECSFDNDITQLIRHTIEFIKLKTLGNAILFSETETRNYVNQIISVTQSYSIQKRQSVINKNLHPFRHSYFSEYRSLQKLCLMILRHDKINYGNNSKKIYGILFDCAWLWEEYLATILKKCGFTHPQNKNQKGALQIFKGRKCYPDFYKGKQVCAQDIPADNCILDAKYKYVDWGVSRNDLYQIISYMHILPSNNG